MIMFLKAKGCPKEIYEQISPYAKKLQPLFDLQVTSYEHAFQIDCMVVDSKTLCGYTSNPKCKIDAAQKHIKNIFTQNGLKDYTVKIFTDMDKFLDRADQLSKEQGVQQNPEAVTLLLDISL